MSSLIKTSLTEILDGCGSDLERAFAESLWESGEQDFGTQCLDPYRRSTERNPRSRPKADFCWREEKVFVEIQGGIWTNGKYNQGAAIETRCIRESDALLDGWLYLRCSPGMVKNKARECLTRTQQLLEMRRG